MKTSGWSSLRAIFVILIGVVALAACGGGGGGGGGDTYSGSTAAAVIDGQTAEEIALSAYEAGDSQYELSLPVGGMSSLALAETLSASLPTDNLAQSASAAAMQSETIMGDCGGSLTVSMNSDASGNFNGSMQYNSYCSGGVTTNGGMNFSGNYDLQTDDLSFTLQFNSLTMSMEGETLLTSSGSISMEMNATDPYAPLDYTMTMVVTDPATGESSKLENYKMIVAPGSGSSDVTVSGRFYHYEFGYVDISTDQAIQVPDYGDYPQSGVIRFDGADGTWATLTFTGSGGYRVEASDGTTVEGLL